MTLLVGLTGGIGCGKSTVSSQFEQLGASVIDSDVISRQLTQANGLAMPALQAAFGEAALDAQGALNRPHMRQLVFANTHAKQQLEAILHPMIRSQMLAKIAAVAPHTPYVLLVIPLLFENQNYRELVQRTLVVDCSEATQITRTMQRSGLNETDVRAVMAQQISRETRLRQADDLIQNEHDLSSLSAQVERLHQRYLAQNVGSD